MLWDAQHALQLRPMLDAVPDPGIRDLVARTLDRYEAVVAPRWPGLRHQVVHTDLCASNVLVDDDGQVSAIIDFGDASWTALVIDPIGVLETMVVGRHGDEAFRSARLAIDGYERVTPLEAEEREIIGELLAARLCAAIVVPAWRSALYADPAALQAELRGEALDALRLLDAAGWVEVGRQLGGRQPGAGWTVPDLAARRRRALGPALTGLSYNRPLHLVGGEGAWLIDAEAGGTSTPTTTCRWSATATRGSSRRSSARRAGSTPTCATCTRRPSRSPSASSRRRPASWTS